MALFKSNPENPFLKTLLEKTQNFERDVSTELTNSKEVQQETICNAQHVDQNVFEQFQCKICCSFLKEPLECSSSECAELVCKECWTNYQQKSIVQKCPNCQQTTVFNKPGRKIRQNLYELLKLKCTNENCTLKGEPIKYEDLLEHALVCPAKTMPCPIGCKEVLCSSQRREKHLNHLNQDCPNAVIQCE